MIFKAAVCPITFTGRAEKIHSPPSLLEMGGVEKVPVAAFLYASFPETIANKNTTTRRSYYWPGPKRKKEFQLYYQLIKPKLPVWVLSVLPMWGKTGALILW